ncbi:involucrin repeat protein [Pseudomassariella vexata]|uniref:Involucrin repeat protein n=1 Tax=Pseudomassariella vexata TaxID=1141098 RepID=A0A1Y2D9Z6_9PEZI|nr:involucrin repeat protein [Pseudomassariella vexata]ORY56091.1 involucrin repeat protein [Pseudomassariella vexata]
MDTPRGPVLVEGYRQDAANNFQQETSRFNPMNTERVQSSVLVDLKDPVQVHLLTETALLDSKEYEILSQEEVDDLKKLCQGLNQRIDQIRSNLAIQSKYRDAAISMSKLYSPTQGKRRSLLGNRNSMGDAAREAEAERKAIQQKCEDLAAELWVLEKRVMEPQRKLLEHTAGILQLTHKSGKKAETPIPRAPLVNGVPASPESMYTANGRNSMEPPDDMLFFDEGSLYRSFDDVGFGGHLPSNVPIEIPLKSPVRGQTKALAEETEKLREDNYQLREEKSQLMQKVEALTSQTRSLSSELDNVKSQGSGQGALITDTGRKLEMFNNQIREMIVKSDPAKNGNYNVPPSGQFEPGDMIGSHLEYLQNALFVVASSQSDSSGAAVKIQALNMRVRDLLSGNPDLPPPPEADADFDAQVGYLQNSLNVIEGELQKAVDLSSAGSESRMKEQQAETVLMGLWEIIQSGYADIRQRKQDRRRTRMEKGLDDDEGDTSDSESFDPNEKYSLSAFSTKVQWLYAQATSLKEQKSVLKRQIKQQRDLAGRSDGEKDLALKSKVEELEQTRAIIDTLEKEVDDVRKQLSQALSDLEQAQDGAQRSISEQSAAVQQAHEQLKERNAQITTLQTSSKDAETRLATAEANIASITTQLQNANGAKGAAEKEAEEMSKQIKAKEEELDQTMGMLAEFKMRATMAEAELDGAYGSRKERAAEVAALANTSENSKLQTKLERLEPQVEKLKNELEATLKDLEGITKQALESESKISDLEVELDKAKDAAQKEKSQLQDELDRERLRHSNGAGSPNPTSKATEIVTERYREQLRSTRQKHAEEMKEALMLRRRLEDELKALKRAGGPGRSPLSPR